ncbi:hypothetical protein [Maribacter cobaltidurans]|uniref:Uncharacterized protein n=1 Tax=Maribacter cobaltidurans TaxID=1178778 RepID=A0A223V390_9FLAO|nr:hypothetical protein [Maribacter cobaltidurans]ASV29874.1 hypothetical protein CJ263_06365 [Maribacter cobaltidurans]GGD91771.1 hypothetical protein GCM10011412_32190 [Maribacter cobaltidurans]
MKKKIDSTLYFFQYLISRINVIIGFGFWIYSIVMQKVDAIIFSSLYLISGVYISKKKFPKPDDLSFDGDFLYLNKLSDPIKMTDIKSLENGVVIYNSSGTICKASLPNYYFIDKNFKKLKKVIENKSTKTQHGAS